MPNQYGGQKVDVSTALDLKINHHLSYAQIAALQGVTPQAIHQRIKDLLPIPETQVYTDHRADILAHTQLRLLSSLDATKVKKMPGRDLVVATGILYDKERLERGKSTGNIGLSVALSADLQGAVDRVISRIGLGELSTGLSTVPGIELSTTLQESECA